jgi:hypothetical protein
VSCGSTTCAPTCISRSSRTHFAQSTWRTSSRASQRATAALAPRASASGGSRTTSSSREKTSLDIAWIRDESLEETDNLPPPDVIAQEIVEDLEAALVEFAAVAASLQGTQPIDDPPSEQDDARAAR